MKEVLADTRVMVSSSGRSLNLDLPAIDGRDGATVTVCRSTVDGATIVFLNDPTAPLPEDDGVFWGADALGEVEGVRVYHNVSLAGMGVPRA